MFRNIFGKKRRTSPPKKPVFGQSSGLVERRFRALKIIHAGGHTERYYIAIPASTVIEKYPSFILAQPEIFKRPWDSIVRPNEILLPSQKYYVVPRHTVKKPGQRFMSPGSSFERQTSIDFTSRDEDSMCIGARKRGILVKPGSRTKVQGKRVQFLDMTNYRKSSSSIDIKMIDGRTNSIKSIMRCNDQIRKTSVGDENAWEPSLNVINE